MRERERERDRDRDYEARANAPSDSAGHYVNLCQCGAAKKKAIASRVSALFVVCIGDDELRASETLPSMPVMVLMVMVMQCAFFFFFQILWQFGSNVSLQLQNLLLSARKLWHA